MIITVTATSTNSYYVKCLDTNDREISVYMGEFNTFNAESDDLVIKEGWSSTDPVLYFNGGKTLQLKVWSKYKNLDESTIRYYDPDTKEYVDTISWVSHTLTAKTKIPGSEYYIYTYDINCSDYSGTESRYCYIIFDILRVPIIQSGKTYNLTVSTESLEFKQAGGTLSVTISCPEGSAYLCDPTVDWLYWKQTSATKIEGSDFYSYTYDIIVDKENTTGAVRTTTLTVGVEGVSTGDVSKKMTITQNDYDYTVTQNNGSLTFDKNGGQRTVTVKTNQLKYPIVCSGTSWMTVSQSSTSVSSNVRTTVFLVNATAYDSVKREGTVVFKLDGISIEDHPESFTSIYAVQYGAEWTGQ